MLVNILWPVSAIVALFIGFWFGAAYYDLKGMKKAFKELSEGMSKIPTNPHESPPTPKSVIVDPTDLAQQVKFEQEEMLRKLNPEMDEDDEV